MIDSETRERVVVSTPEMGGAYIMLPFDQVADIEAILRANEVPFWTDSDSISMDGEPAIIVVNLEPEADVSRVQQLLDAAH
jgi:hypothetical protein